MATTTLGAVPSLVPLFVRGALLSPVKRPRPDAEFARERLVVPGLRVDLARLSAYERVCGFDAGDGSLPVTYPHVLGFPLAMRLMSARSFPLPLLGLVHTSIEISRYEALAAGGVYELGVHVSALAAHRRGTEASVVTELRCEGGLVWESRSTYLARHRTTVAPEKVTEALSDPVPLTALDEWRLAGDLGRRYASASGDRNPIHLHPLTARLFGFPRAIAHGMWTAARCLAAQETPSAVRVRAEFRAPVLLPSVVAFASGGGRFELREKGRDGVAGRVHVSGRVDALTGRG
ncbi:MaoC family dehydratase [Streptomyces sp. S6]